MAQLMKNNGSVLAMDHNEKKLEKLTHEMTRLGAVGVSAAVGDISKKLDGCSETFDKVMLDAPCSGLGVLRRNPDAKWTMTRERLNICATRQSLFLDNIAHCIKPTGSLVYAVCSMEPEENEAVAEKFLERHPEFSLDKTVSGFPESARHLIQPSGFFKSYPHLHDMDGFFAACFKKTGP
jgi:16S rRNA (cytosine967-C5)-methyltransferase